MPKIFSTYVLERAQNRRGGMGRHLKSDCIGWDKQGRRGWSKQGMEQSGVLNSQGVGKMGDKNNQGGWNINEKNYLGVYRLSWHLIALTIENLPV